MKFKIISGKYFIRLFNKHIVSNTKPHQLSCCGFGTNRDSFGMFFENQSKSATFV
ncbi:hypothetical protein CSC40_1332 [Klebsiella pneumoniae]|nr:hypothetical protein CSC40_1332 [Klebsiella pneumoniae]